MRSNQGNGASPAWRRAAVSLCLGMGATATGAQAQNASTGTADTPTPVILLQPASSPPAQASANTHQLAPAREFQAPARDPAYTRAATTAPAVPLPQRVRLAAGQAAVFKLDRSLRRVAVGNGDLVEVSNIGSREILMMGAKAGETTLHLWMGDGSQFSVPVMVTAADNASLAALVEALTADVDGVRVHEVGDRVVVTGHDVSPALAGRLVELQKSYPQLMDMTTPDPVGMRPMVRMDVKIMEFDTNALEELGIEWDNVIQGPVAGLIKDFTTNDYFRVLPEGSPFEQLDLPTSLPGSQRYLGIATTIGSQINLLMNQGKAVLLASPQLSARSGGAAKFLVGGEVPIPVPQGFGQVTVDYKEYGIKLDIEPVVNGNDEVFARLLAEVSRIDPTVTVEGVPGFTTRRTESEINVKAGQTLVVSGLIDSGAAKDVKKLPLLGDIPILGRLFRSEGFRGSRTELVMFVTPRVVTPESPENLQDLERARELRDKGLEAMPRRNQDFIQ